jgi:DNA processing protein
MLDLRTAVALALVPGQARTDISARLRERWPDLVRPDTGRPDASAAAIAAHAHASAPSPTPSLPALLAALSPGAGDPAALAPALERRAADALERAGRCLATPLVLGDPRYPPLLAAIYDPPLVLWVRGDLTTLDRPSVALVGARAATPGGLEAARWLAADLALAGVVVVSGLARGIDGAAHAGALETGQTVAVLGSGVDRIYPAMHTRLASRVAAAGALASEFVPGTAPHAHHFPMRNRIISGLCAATVVVEAAAKSGSLITARCALEQGREVMAVPGSTRSGRNRGAHLLIRDGARLIESAADVLDELGWVARATRSGQCADPSVDDPLLQAMPVGEPVHLEQVATALGTPAASLLARMSEHELHGRIARASGGRFVRVGR